MIITIDGPTASGKSTIGRLLAQQLGAYYIYSGLFYRALAYLLMQHESRSPEDLVQVAPELISTYLDSQRLTYVYDQGKERILFDSKDITPYVYEPVIDRAASLLSTNSAVRPMITELVRVIAGNKDVIIDGRDAGTYMFPQADIKFYLTACPDVRAERWLKRQLEMGKNYTLEQAREITAERDERDRTREHAPLVIASDAVIIDSSDLDKQQTLEKMLKMIDGAE